MKKLYTAVLVSITVLAGFSMLAAYAQTELVSGVEINSTQALTVVLIGVAAGFLVAYQGARTTPEDFDTLKFFDGVMYSVVGSVPLAIGTALTVNLDIFGYVTVFFAAIGVGHQLKKTRRRTIPSNATDDEIEAILKGE